MTVILGIDALEGAIGMPEAIDLLERTLAHEAAGRTSASPKYVTDYEGGAMRILVAADAEAGYLATLLCSSCHELQDNAEHPGRSRAQSGRRSARSSCSGCSS
jgi:hypothetical protein